MEDLAAYAVMASASVGLFREIFFPADEERLEASRESGFLQSRLSLLRRQEDEDDDLTVALLSTLWQDEVIACVAAESSGNNTQSSEDEDQRAAPAPAPAPETETPSPGSPPPPPKMNKSSSASPPPSKRLKPTFGDEDDEFGLRLNLENGSGSSGQFGVSFQSPTPQFLGDFFNHHRLDVEPLEHQQQHLGDELALGNEHSFISHHHFSQEQSSRDWDSEENNN